MRSAHYLLPKAQLFRLHFPAALPPAIDFVRFGDAFFH
jgi:hypothetical protein